MSVSYGIINRHGGTIRVDSTEGKGSTFVITIPISDNIHMKEEEENLMPEEMRKSTILIIEDEEEVRNLLADILIANGHQVEKASDGNRGIEMFKKKDFDLVFTDLGMPEMSGWEVAETIKTINDKIPVAVITGWNVDLEDTEMQARGVNLIVNKPFQVNQILQLVQEGMEWKKRFEAA
jgi:CheY-like chemotaxis protein